MGRRRAFAFVAVGLGAAVRAACPAHCNFRGYCSAPDATLSTSFCICVVSVLSPAGDRKVCIPPMDIARGDATARLATAPVSRCIVSAPPASNS